MNSERTPPKKKIPKPKPELDSTTTSVIDNPPTDGLGGKAGKSNLYNTTKPTARGNQSSRSSAQKSCSMLDLHGLAVDEALAKLDESLPTWVDAAMKGEYPWVIPVKIVCGGRSQLLSEAVETWIKKTDQVANAPKNLY